MRAEYPEGVSPRDAGARVELWHMVRGGAATAMCGRELDPAAATMSSDAWATSEATPFCHTCGALFLRETPEMPET